MIKNLFAKGHYSSNSDDDRSHLFDKYHTHNATTRTVVYTSLALQKILPPNKYASTQVNSMLY